MEKISVVFIIILVPTFPNYICSSENYYDLCKPFLCGNISFSFPFSPTDKFGILPLDCGLPRYQISCDSNPAIELSGRLYTVKQLSLPADFSSVTVTDNSGLITVVDDQLISDLNSLSCESLRNLTISTVDVAPLGLPSWGINLTLYRCPSGVSVSQSQHLQFFSTLLNFNYTCQEGYKLHLAREVRRNETQFQPPRLSPELPPAPTGCEFVPVPVSRTILSSFGFLNSSGGENGILLDPSFRVEELIVVLREGFPLEWPSLGDCGSCQSNGGRCVYDRNSKKVDCFCRTGRNCQQAS